MGKLLSMTGYGSAKGSVEGQEITVTVKGFNAMSGYRYKTPAELKAAAKAVEGLQLGWVDPESGAFTAIENAITDENISISGERIAVRISIINDICTFVISVVRRVTSEAGLNLSIFENENL